jgi:hypothetical protein
MLTLLFIAALVAGLMIGDRVVGASAVRMPEPVFFGSDGFGNPA